MRKRLFSALFIILIGLGYILIPRFVFPICEFASGDSSSEASSSMDAAPSMGMADSAPSMRAHGSHPAPPPQDSMQGHGGHAAAPPPASNHAVGEHMACWYSWRAEIGNGLAVILGGLILLFSGSAGARRAIRLMLSGLAVIGTLYITVLIGVCPGASMPCRTGTLPAMIILGGILLIASLGGLILGKKEP